MALTEVAHEMQYNGDDACNTSSLVCNCCSFSQVRITSLTLQSVVAFVSRGSIFCSECLCMFLCPFETLQVRMPAASAS
jgi:hypothetical protein